MGNTFNKATWVTMESLRTLLNKLEVGQFFNTDLSREYKKPFPIGASLNVKLPWRPIVRDGVGYAPQGIERLTTPVTIDQICGVDFEWDSIEKALDMERGQDIVKREYIDPAIAALAQDLDSRCANYARYHTPNVSGALGTTPTALSTYLAADQFLYEQSCPPENRGLIVSAGMSSTIAGQLTTITNPAAEISHQYKKGFMREAAGFEWYRSNSLYDHTCGTWANTLTVQTTPSNGATSVVVGGTAAETLKRGDIFKFSASYGVNPDDPA